jgi:hypothetical protein
MKQWQLQIKRRYNFHLKGDGFNSHPLLFLIEKSKEAIAVEWRESSRVEI